MFPSLATLEAMLTSAKFCPGLLRVLFDNAHAWHFVSVTMFSRLATRAAETFPSPTNLATQET